MIKIAVLISGGGTNLQAVIDSLQEGRITNAEISLVISNKEDAYGLKRAEKAGIRTAVLSPKSFESRADFDRALMEMLEQAGIDLVVLAGYLVIIPSTLVEKYRNRMMNIHPSLIPSFSGTGAYGLKVHEQVLERGVKVTGATVHFVDEGTDTGPIILQKAVAVRDEDDAQSLQQRVMEEAEWKILPEAIRLFCNNKLFVEGTKVRIKE